MAATLLILRTTELLTPSQGTDTATTVAIGLCVGYNVAATLAAVPAGRLADVRGACLVFGSGVVLFAVAYFTFAAGSATAIVLGAAFAAAGIGIGAAETAENAAVASLAPSGLRGSAFGLLAAIQSAGDFIASALVGLLWTLVSPTVAFRAGAAFMLAAFAALAATVGGIGAGAT